VQNPAEASEPEIKEKRDTRKGLYPAFLPPDLIAYSWASQIKPRRLPVYR
jgi:hypothetical protein